MSTKIIDNSDEEPEEENEDLEDPKINSDQDIDSDVSDKEEKSDEEKVNEDEEIFDDTILEDADPIDQEELEDEQDIEDDGDESNVFDENKKKSSRKKTIKRKLFPFIKKKKNTYINQRDPPIYMRSEERELGLKFIENQSNIKEKEITVFEKAIHNSAVRLTNNNGLEYRINYVEIMRYFVGALQSLKKSEIIQELKSDKVLWNSKLFDTAINAEQKELAKIKNPVEVTDDLDNPCPKCSGTKIFKAKKQLRSGDEGQSIQIWCCNNKCKYYWRING
jgi:DNA-directed RNA polymerase subunit M/transcription elongation factor TFIIS